MNLKPWLAACKYLTPKEKISLFRQLKIDLEKEGEQDTIALLSEVWDAGEWDEGSGECEGNPFK